MIDQPCTQIKELCRHGGGVAFIGGPPDEPDDVWLVERPGQAARRLRAPSPGALDTTSVSMPEPFELVGRSGRPVYGVLYRPTLHGVERNDEMRPPLVVSCHGGPTSSAGSGFDVMIQFFTSRGFALARVDYAGSSGYGRDYRCSLWGKWGEADSQDCVDAARYLAEQGAVRRGPHGHPRRQCGRADRPQRAGRR